MTAHITASTQSGGFVSVGGDSIAGSPPKSPPTHKVHRIDLDLSSGATDVVLPAAFDGTSTAVAAHGAALDAISAIDEEFSAKYRHLALRSPDGSRSFGSPSTDPKSLGGRVVSARDLPSALRSPLDGGTGTPASDPGSCSGSGRLLSPPEAALLSVHTGDAAAPSLPMGDAAPSGYGFSLDPHPVEAGVHVDAAAAGCRTPTGLSARTLFDRWRQVPAGSAFSLTPSSPPRPAFASLIATATERLDRIRPSLLVHIRDNPLFAAYKPVLEGQHYKLFIDANRWPTPDKVTRLETDLCFDVKEPGYTAAMMEAFIWLMKKEGPLTPDILRDLHDKATSEVLHVNDIGRATAFEAGYRSRAKSIERACTEQFKLARGSTVSEAGFGELISKITDGQYETRLDPEEAPFNLFDTALDKPSQTIVLSPPALPTVKITVNKAPFSYEISSAQLSTNTPEQIADALIAALLHDRGGAVAIDRSRIIGNVRIALGQYNTTLQAYKSPRIVLRPPNSNVVLEKSVGRLIELYYAADKSTEDKKLEAIVRLVQNLDQLHPFYDGNIRSFAVLLLQRLLVENGLTPSCLDDPNCFDCLSVAELMAAVRRGQDNFRRLTVA